MSRKLVVGVGAVLAIGVVVAAHHGDFDCGSCTLSGATPDSDTVSFIKSVVNGSVEQWRNGDTVTICNSNTCATYLMASVMGGIGGMQQIAKFQKGGDSGGGGGGNEGGSGNYDGGGCVGSCGGGTGGTGGSGTVVVGDPDKVVTNPE
ncbi:hypothetical protein [Marilutibacter maris]|uniref:hypothetical protein n=1 Tax=Marilutibacter maris TaxID=1605891 RepID=UPI0011AE904C|nr:hypothetical protein [Lysobacter maris]